jgi:hypothetical protein
MKAIKTDNGQIVTYGRLPLEWKDENGLHLNFRKTTDPTVFGFYDVVTPEYDKVTQGLSEIQWDDEKNIFTYSVVEKDVEGTYEHKEPIVDEDGKAVLDADGEPTYNVTTKPIYDKDKLKAQFIESINAEAGRRLQPTDWYVIRKAERDVTIPSNIVGDRLELLSRADELIAEVNALTTAEALLKYTFEFFPVVIEKE